MDLHIGIRSIYILYETKRCVCSVNIYMAHDEDAICNIPLDVIVAKMYN